MSKHRHWYHCTDRRTEQAWTAVRRAPITKASSEPSTPRLCVSPTVAQALAAAWWSGERPVRVYITEKRRTVPPTGVWDAVMTGERWIIPPVRLTLLATIPATAIEAAQVGLAPTITGQRWSHFGQRFVNMVEVVRTHVPEAHERWLESFAVGVRDLLVQRDRERDEERARLIDEWVGPEWESEVSSSHG
jgi:hypothetical protein